MVEALSVQKDARRRKGRADLSGRLPKPLFQPCRIVTPKGRSEAEDGAAVDHSGGLESPTTKHDTAKGSKVRALGAYFEGGR